MKHWRFIQYYKSDEIFLGETELVINNISILEGEIGYDKINDNSGFFNPIPLN